MTSGILSSLDLRWLSGALVSAGALTFLFPLAAASMRFVFRIRQKKEDTAPVRIELDILIPAYNEADTILPTLHSLQKAIAHLMKNKPDSRVQVIVGIDGATDNTPELVATFARSKPQFTIRNQNTNAGKWNMLRQLVAQSAAPWVAFVDAGTLWPPEFLTQIESRLRRRGYVGLAPGYRQEGARFIERLVWWQERMLKSLENLAGGPFSLHGATMIFQNEALKEAFRFAGTRAWLNDDVVLGLALRTRGQIDYLGSWLCVSDIGVRNKSDTNRRARMAAGNLEWIRELLPRVFTTAPIVFILALRRVARLFWAYFVFAIAIFLGLTLNQGWYGMLAITFLAMFPCVASGRLRAAFLVSLRTPALLRSSTHSTAWT